MGYLKIFPPDNNKKENAPWPDGFASDKNVSCTPSLPLEETGERKKLIGRGGEAPILLLNLVGNRAWALHFRGIGWNVAYYHVSLVCCRYSNVQRTKKCSTRHHWDVGLKRHFQIFLSFSNLAHFPCFWGVKTPYPPTFTYYEEGTYVRP